MAKGGVLFVHAVPDTGGSTRVAIEDAKALADDGFEVGFAADRDGVFEELAGRRIRFHRLRFADPERYSRLVRYSIGAVYATMVLVWAVLRYRYANLYVQHRQSGWPSRIASRLTGVRYVFISHSELGRASQGRWATPLGSNIIAVSEHVKRNAITCFGVPEGDVTVIPNSVETDVRRPAPGELREWERRHSIPEDARPVACVARLAAGKGHDVLLRAWAQVVRAVPDALLLVAGDGPLAASLERMAAEQSVASRVRFLGFVRDVSLVYARAEFAVLASRSEGMPLSVLEAFAYGIPVVATAIPAITDLVVDGETGVIVPLDDVDALADGVIRLLSHDEERRRLGAAGRLGVVARHSRERRGRVLCQFFDQAIG